MSNKALIFIIIAIVVVCASAAGAFYWQQTRPLKVTDEQIRMAQDSNDNPSTSSGPNGNKTEMAGNECQRNFDENKFKTDKVAIANRQVEMQVQDFGSIILSFDEKAAPKTVENFLKLVNAGFYSCLTFHRIVAGFVVQGGDPLGTGQGGPGFTVPAEVKLLHKRGSVAMARLDDSINPNRESSGSQFYIALKDLPQLDGGYTVFGTVVSGMDVIDKIAAVQTGTNDAPIKPVVMSLVKIIK